MTKADELHDEAMNLAEAADRARRQRDAQRVVELLHEAFTKEQEAASLVSDEPSRSILLRSAASLALEYGNIREAERCIATALAGEPPVEIADELRDLMEEAYFSRHLDLRGMTLGEDEFQMSIAGDDVSYGMAKSERFLRRADHMLRLLHRTVERKAHQAFRDAPQQAKETPAGGDRFEVFMSVPRAASFAVSFRIARPQDQGELFPSVTPKEIVSEVLTCLDLLNRGEEAKLKEHIGDDVYFENFVGIAKQIAPDGKAIKVVGFTSGEGEADDERVKFVRAAKSIKLVKEEAPLTATTKTVQGRLRFADDLNHKSPKIRIVDAQGQREEILVPPGLMNDVVRPLWDYEVVVTCEVTASGARLTDIRRAEDSESA